MAFIATKMTCDGCNGVFNYCFHINDEYWRKVVGEEEFEQRRGRHCAHCTLEKLGGASWYIVWNEPVEKQRQNRNETAMDAASTGRRGERQE